MLALAMRLGGRKVPAKKNKIRRAVLELLQGVHTHHTAGSALAEAWGQSKRKLARAGFGERVFRGAQKKSRGSLRARTLAGAAAPLPDGAADRDWAARSTARSKRFSRSASRKKTPRRLHHLSRAHAAPWFLPLYPPSPARPPSPQSSSRLARAWVARGLLSLISI